MQTPQNTPTSTNVEETPIKDIRIPKIIDKRLSGESWSNIAQDLDINRKTLYDIRQKDEYFQYFYVAIYPLALKRLEEILDDPGASDYKLMRAIDESLKHMRAYIPKQFESKSAHLDVQIRIDEDRVQADRIWGLLDEDTRAKIRGALLTVEDSKE